MFAARRHLMRTGVGVSPSTLVETTLLLVLAGYALVAGLSEILGIDNRTLSLVMRGATLGIAIVAIVAILRREHRLQVSPMWLLWWLFWTTLLARALLDYGFENKQPSAPLYQYIAFGVGASLLPAVAIGLGGRLVHPVRAAMTLTVLLMAGAIGNFVVILGKYESFELGAWLGARLESETFNPIQLGQLGASLILLGAWRLSRRLPTGRAGALMALSGIAIGGFSLVFAASRGPALGLAIALLLVFAARGAGVARRWTFAAFAVLAITGFAFLLASEESLLITRLTETLFTDPVRFRLFEETSRLPLASWLFGAGIEPLWTYPHNLLIESYMAVGVFTGLSFTVLFAYSLLVAWHVARTDPSSAWLAALFVLNAVLTLVSGSLAESSAFWLLLAMMIGLGGVRQSVASRWVRS